MTDCDALIAELRGSALSAPVDGDSVLFDRAADAIDALRTELVREMRRAEKAETERDAARAELAEARALYVGAQEDLNDSVGSVVALRAELAAQDSSLKHWKSEVLRVRHEQAAKTEHWKVERTLRLDADAAIARVRELCSDHDPEMTFPEYQQAILAALEGTDRD